jgi:hypothetical protein
MPTMAAAAYRYSIGWPIRYPRNNLEYVTRFLHMMFEVPSEPLQLSPVAAKALDLLFILHADHEQNASTSTVRLVGSTGANPYACVAAGIAALWGPAHGGANEAVLKMLEEIGDAKNVDKAVAKAKDKESGFRLMGFGHRVYKNYDPRAAIIREMCHKVLADLGVNDPLLDVAMAAGRSRAQGFVLRRAQALSQRRFLLGPDLQGAEDSDRDVHRDVRDRRARPAGSRTGSSSTWTRKPRSAGRARSTRVRRRASISRSASADSWGSSEQVCIGVTDLSVCRSRRDGEGRLAVCRAGATRSCAQTDRPRRLICGAG